MKTTINCKRGGCIVVIVKRGGKRGEVASSALSHKGDNVEKKWERGDSDSSFGMRGCVFVIIVVVERCGQRHRGEGGKGTKMKTMAGGRRGGRVFVVNVSSLLALYRLQY
jgi:hypothetical protein